MTLERCVHLKRPVEGKPEITRTLGDVLAQLQEEAEAQLGHPALADAVAQHTLMERLGKVRVSWVPDGPEELDEGELTPLAAAS